jgi:hypothetical protein
MFEVHINVDMMPLEKYFKHIVQRGDKFNTALLTLWAVRYRREMLKRWKKLSRGGGEWPRLKPSTLRRRRNKNKKTAKILIDTGILRDALTPGMALDNKKPGAYSEPVYTGIKISTGIRVGFGGPERHDEAGFSVAKLALWHHTGAGRLPVRQLLVDPSKQTVTGMSKDVVRIFNLIKRAEGMD